MGFEGLPPNRERVLVAVDFSPASLAAARYGCDLARKLDGCVQLVHVVDTTGRAAMAEGKLVPEKELDQAQRRIEQRLHGVQQELLAEPGLDIACHVVRGDPVRALLGASEGAFMLVMGTAGRQGLERVLLGSLAEQLVRRSKTPVLTVHADGTLARVA